VPVLHPVVVLRVQALPVRALPVQALPVQALLPQVPLLLLLLAVSPQAPLPLVRVWPLLLPSAFRWPPATADIRKRSVTVKGGFCRPFLLDGRKARVRKFEPLSISCARRHCAGLTLP